jgi:DeoR/GlpR family transcriptional regulator of sugar metabolism
MFSVSEMTIRRDLDELQKQGLLKRTYGGAAATESAFFEVSLRAKMAQFVDEKERIGKAAADMVRDGHTVLLSGGSTTFQVAKDLKCKRITVVTNALNIASELLTCSQIKILVVGGILSQSSACSVGPQAVAFLQEVRADILFLGVEGIDVSGGLTVPDVIEAHTNRAMVKSAGQTVVVVDHSKLGRNALSTIAPIDGVDLIISDKGAPEHIVEQLGEYVKIHLV